MDAALIASLASGGGLVFVALALIFDVYTHRIEHLRQRRQATIETYFSSHDFRQHLRTEVRDKLGELGGRENLSEEEGRELAEADDERTRALNGLLNHYEYISAAVNASVFDFETLRRLSRHSYIRVYDRYYPFIYARRQQPGRETLFSEFSEFVKRLREANDSEAASR